MFPASQSPRNDFVGAAERTETWAARSTGISAKTEEKTVVVTLLVMVTVLNVAVEGLEVVGNETGIKSVEIKLEAVDGGSPLLVPLLGDVDSLRLVPEFGVDTEEVEMAVEDLKFGLVDEAN